MYETILLRERALRHRSEPFIRDVYAAEYGATYRRFLLAFFALLSDRRMIVCPAVFRSQGEGFFSERYLDSPIEKALSALAEDSM
jgi:hypothetical protein